MSAVYVQRGESLDYTNATGKEIKAGDIVDLSSRIGVAGTNIGLNAVGSIHMIGVFEMPKEASLEIAQGDSVYYNATDGVITKTDTDTPAGYAAATSTTTSSVVLVKLLG